MNKTREEVFHPPPRAVPVGGGGRETAPTEEETGLASMLPDNAARFCLAHEEELGIPGDITACQMLAATAALTTGWLEVGTEAMRIAPNIYTMTSVASAQGKTRAKAAVIDPMIREQDILMRSARAHHEDATLPLQELHRAQVRKFTRKLNSDLTDNPSGLFVGLETLEPPSYPFSFGLPGYSVEPEPDFIPDDPDDELMEDFMPSEENPLGAAGNTHSRATRIRANSQALARARLLARDLSRSPEDRERYILDQATEISIVHAMRSAYHNSVFLQTPEARTWVQAINSRDASGKRWREIFNQCYDGQNIDLHRTNPNHRIHLPHAWLNVHFGVHHDVAKSFLLDDVALESGMISRFLVFHVRGRRDYSLRFPGEATECGARWWRDKIRSLDRLRRTHKGRPRLIPLEADALAMLKNLAHPFEEDGLAQDGSLRDTLLKRFRLNVLKVAALLAVLANDGPLDKTLVTGRDIGAAVRILLRSHNDVVEMLATDDRDKNEIDRDDLVACIKASKGGVQLAHNNGTPFSRPRLQKLQTLYPETFTMETSRNGRRGRPKK